MKLTAFNVHKNMSQFLYESDGADAPPRQAHATKTNNAENQTERRGGAEPSPLNRLGSAAAFPPCDPFSLLVLPFRSPFEFCLFRSA